MKKFTTRPRVFPSNLGYVGTQNYDSKGWVYLGRLAETGPLTDVRFDTDISHVIALFGKRGSGKSYTLGSLLEGLCTANAESSIAANRKNSAVLLFDTLGVFQWMGMLLQEDSEKEILQEQFAVRRGWKIAAEPLALSVWIPKGTRTPGTPANYREFTINCSDFSAEDWGYLFGLDVYRDRMGQLLNDAYIKVTQEGWRDSARRHPSKPDYSIDDLVACVQHDAELTDTYHDETRRAIVQQFKTYRRNQIFEHQGTPLRKLLTPGHMSVVVMNKMSDELRLVVVSALMRRLIAARVQASEAEKHLKIQGKLSSPERLALKHASEMTAPQTWVAIDEAQNILPSERKTSATDVMVKYVREGRNYGLSFVIATQQPTAIDPRILAQVDTLLVHKLTVQGDIDYIRKNLKSNAPDEVRYGSGTLGFDQLIRSLDVGQALVSNTETDRAFIMNVRPRISVHGGF